MSVRHSTTWSNSVSTLEEALSWLVLTYDTEMSGATSIAMSLCQEMVDGGVAGWYVSIGGQKVME